MILVLAAVVKNIKNVVYKKEESEALEISKAKIDDKGLGFFDNVEDDFDFDFAEIENDRNLPAGMFENLSQSESEYFEEWDAEFEGLESSEEKLLHFEKILYERPDIVEKVELDPEILFDINVDYQKLDKLDEYIAFLKKFRQDFPDVYSHNAEYYDYSIIAYLLASGQKKRDQ